MPTLACMHALLFRSLLSFIVIASLKQGISIRTTDVYQTRELELEGRVANLYQGPPRIVTRCRFAQSASFGNLVAEYYPNEICPAEIEQSWKCYLVCLQSAKKPAGVSASGEAKFAGNKVGILRSFTYRVDSNRRREEGELVFLASLGVDAAYFDAFQEFHGNSDSCANRGQFGAQARERHGRNIWRPDFSGILHCARGGCVPGSGGWSSPGSCTKSMWSVVNHVFRAAEGLEQALVMLNLPHNSYALASCRYEQQFEGGRRELVTRVVSMARLPRCQDVMPNEIWKCYQHCPGGSKGAAQLKDQSGVADDLIRTDLVHREILSVEDKKVSGPKSILRSILLYDTITLTAREFVFRRGFPTDAETWMSFTDTLQTSPVTAAEAWSETKNKAHHDSKGDVDGFRLMRNREAPGLSVVEHILKAARWIRDVSHSEMAYIRFGVLANVLQKALNNFEVSLGWRSLTKPDPGLQEAINTKRVGQYHRFLESLLRRIADRISQRSRDTHASGRRVTGTRERKVAFGQATLQLTEARDQLIVASQAAFGDHH